MTPPPRFPCFSLSHLPHCDRKRGCGGAGCYGLRVARIVWTLGPSPPGDPGHITYHFSHRIKSTATMILNVRTYTVTTWWSNPPSTPLVSLPPLSNHMATFVWVRIRGFLPSRRDYVWIRLWLRHFPTPFRGERCFLVVVTHVHGGRNVPPGAESVSKLYRAE